MGPRGQKLRVLGMGSQRKGIDKSPMLQSEGPRRECPEDPKRYIQEKMSGLNVYQHQKDQYSLTVALLK